MNPIRLQGYATQVIEQAESKAKYLGAINIGLSVFSCNYGAQALYQKLGYNVTNINMIKSLR
ncbi:MAG: GNAT family N-acetyltransferase [Alphaproteobacteria bacterium]|nr:GNAT family N-acetyltransferase [Alphaproteobacteria bacterium]